MRAQLRSSSLSARGARRAAPGARRVAARAVAATPEDNQAVWKRSKVVHSREELDAAFALAAEKEKLVILSITDPDMCELVDFPDESDVSKWNDTDPSNMEPCRQLYSSIARISAESDQVDFVELEGHESSETRSMCEELGVKRFPSFQYYKGYELLWQHSGAGGDSARNIGEGVLYFGGQGAGGEAVEESIMELRSQEDYEDFLETCAAPQVNPRGVALEVECDKQLAIVDVSKQKDSPDCVHVFPAVVSLARNTAGACRWARTVVDSSPASALLGDKLGVTAYPTFVFFADGKEVGRYHGTDRMALVNKVLEFQRQNGVRLPEPPPRKRMSTAEAKAIAAQKRAQDKRRPNGW